MKTTEYHIEWAIQLDAVNPTEAARAALECIKAPDTTAHVFDVSTNDGRGAVTRIDLTNGGRGVWSVLAEFTGGDTTVYWLRSKRGGHRVEYGLQSTLFNKADDLAASAEFGACVRHSLECANLLD